MNDDSGKILWFTAGAAIGVSLAILFAPVSGDDARKTILRKTGEGREALADSGREMMQRGRELFERGKQLADEAADMFEKGRNLVDSTAANLQSNLRQTQS